MHGTSDVAPADDIAAKIHTIRGARVMLDSDLAALYGVSTSRLNEQVKRNPSRFPSDFAFRLTPTQLTNLISPFATSSSHHGGRRKLPLAFNEHGAVMAANVLSGPRAPRQHRPAGATNDSVCRTSHLRRGPRGARARPDCGPWSRPRGWGVAHGVIAVATGTGRSHRPGTQWNDGAAR